MTWWKLFKFLKILIICEKGNTKKTANETKEQKGGFLVMLLGTLGASLLVNMLTGKEILRGGYGNKKGKGMLRADYRSKMYFYFHSIF